MVDKLIEKISYLGTLQDSFNKVINDKWVRANYAWYRAAWIEAGELVDHMKYKWWKNIDQEIDRDQCLLELVDIFHFIISDVIVRRPEGGASFIAGSYNKVKTHVVKQKEDVILQVEDFVEITLANSRNGIGIPVDRFFSIVISLGFNFDDLYQGYIRKNVLNHFRQDFGYKTGEYVKEWFKQEDNIWLIKFVNELGDDLTFDTLYDKMRAKYQEVLAQQ